MKTPSAFRTTVLAATLALVPRPAAPQVVTTFAGSGAAGSADGVGASATFDHPGALAVDSSGNVYVAQHAAVRKTTPAGVVTTLPVSVTWPSAIATDAAGNLYVVDLASGHPGIDRILRVAPSGQVTKVADGPMSWGLSGIVIDASGNVIVADPGEFIEGTGGGRLLKLDSDGMWLPLTGPGKPFQVDDPWNVTADAAGNLYVTTWGGSVLELGVRGTTTTLASGLGFGGIAVDRAGGVYVTESEKQQILKIEPRGGMTVVAGTGAGGDLDGPGDTATFSSPAGLGLDGAGNLYVADSGNNKIRKITLVGAACGPYCTNWFVPSVAHVAGADGSFWTSDLVLHNRGSSPTPVTLKFLGNSRDGTSGPERSLTLDPFQTVTSADVLASVFGIADDAGALEVLTPSDQLTVRSRTFTAAAGGTVGDGMPGVRQGSFFTDQTTPVPVLIGLTEDGRFRSNLILVNGTASPLDVRVDAIDASGAAIGSRTYTLPPLGMIQDSRFLMEAEFGGQPKAGATVTLSSPTPGAAFTASAVVIDNASNAPTTVMPQ